MVKRWGKNDKERLEKSLDICLKEVERLKKLVNDMLLLSKAEKSVVDLNKVDKIDPVILVDEVIEQYRFLNPNVTYIVNIDENIRIKLEVKDNGIGIPKNEIDNVKKRFYKVDKSRVNNNSFGIGLSIANRIVSNYNSKIYIESELDKYTIISVYFKG